LQSSLTLSNFQDVGVGLNSETRYATARQFVLKKPLFNKLQLYENTVNYKRKSRRRFFLLMRLRTPPISSEFQGGFEPPKPPPSVRHWCRKISTNGHRLRVWFGRDGIMFVSYFSVSIVMNGFSYAAQSLWCLLRGWCVFEFVCRFAPLCLSICLSGFTTAVAVFRKPNAIPSVSPLIWF